MDSLNTVFGQLIHNLRDAFSTTSTTSSTGTNTTTSPNLAIATIFPLLDKQTKQLLEVDENDYLQVLSATPSISSFARQLFFDNSIAN